MRPVGVQGEGDLLLVLHEVEVPVEEAGLRLRLRLK